MSDEGYIEPEIDLTGEAPRKEMMEREPSLAPSIQIVPEKLTTKWIAAQAPRRAWRAPNLILTPELVLHMHKLRRRGLSPAAICGRVGVTTSTWYSWDRRADRGEEPYQTWKRVIMHATGELEDELLNNVRNAAIDDWKASTWLLSKINRQEYSDKVAGGGITNIHVDGDAVEKKQVNSLSETDAQKIASLMGQIGALPPGTVDAEIVEDK